MATPPVFSAGAVLTAAQMNDVGMWLVTTQTFTATSDLNIDNCFTSDFENYRIVGRFSSSNNGISVNFRWRTSSGDDTGAYYWRRGFYYTTGVFDLSQSGQTSDFICNASNTASAITSFSMDVYTPQSSSFRTNYNLQSYENNTPLSVWNQGAYVNPVAHTGISIYPAAGTFTGKISIYGYRND